VIIAMQHVGGLSKPCSTMPLFKRPNPLTIANVINANWLGIARSCPSLRGKKPGGVRFFFFFF